MHSAPYFAILMVLAVILSARTVRLRRRYKVGVGSGDHLDLGLAIRAFGNFVEYTSLGLVLILALEMAQTPPTPLHIIGGLLVVGRFAHAAGMSTNSGYSAGRTWGMILTYSSLILGSAFLMWFASHPV